MSVLVCLAGVELDPWVGGWVRRCVCVWGGGKGEIAATEHHSRRLWTCSRGRSSGGPADRKHGRINQEKSGGEDESRIRRLGWEREEKNIKQRVTHMKARG